VRIQWEEIMKRFHSIEPVGEVGRLTNDACLESGDGGTSASSSWTQVL